MNAGEVIRLLEKNEDLVRSKAVFNCHIEGTHSLVLKDSDDLMVRLYVIPLGKLHPCHDDWSLPFLYHSHRYDFVSGPVLGSIRNQRVKFQRGPFMDGKPGNWHAYLFDSPLMPRLNVGASRLVYANTARCNILSDEWIKQGDLYQMDAREVHRVGFYPDPQTGWFVGQFFEFEDRVKPSYCYWREKIDMSVFGKLYNKPTEKQMTDLLSGLKDALKKSMEG